MLRPTLLLLFIVLSMQLYAQDTTWYHQKSAIMFGNSYAFVRVHAGDKEGIFFQEIHTDDFQSWISAGRFAERRRKIIIHPAPPLRDSVFHYPGHTKDTTVIYWKDYLGHVYCGFDVKYADVVVYNDSFKSNYDREESVHVANKTLASDSVIMRCDAWGKTIHLKLLPGDSVVVVSANLSAGDSFDIIDRKRRVLHKTRKGFVTQTIWDRKKRGLFVKQVR